MKRRYTLIDLFAGCGGISRGFEWTGKFGTQFAAELVGHPANTFVANIRNADNEPTRMYQGDVQRLVDDLDFFWREMNAVGISAPGQLDVLAGGPPCQGFSRNGVRKYRDQGRRRRFFDDPRNHLYKAFLRIVEELKPKIVLVENVREFLNFGGGKFSSDLLAKFAELGYAIDFRKVCAADLGVPQMRHRVFFVAVRLDVSKVASVSSLFPVPEFAAPGVQLSLVDRPYRTVRDALSDLPAPTNSKLDPPVRYLRQGSSNDYARMMRNTGGVVSNHFVRPLSEMQKQRIRAVGSGRMKHIKKSLQTRAFYGSAYRRLSWDEPALTITTWVYHVGSGRFAHPEEDRGITMREAARLQSFDDSFVFPPLVNPVSQMIGNAVPPLVANRFAVHFVRALDAYYELTNRFNRPRRRSVARDLLRESA